MIVMVSSYFNNHKITIEYNNGGLLPIPCVCCGKLCIRERRVDTVTLFEEIEETYCPTHWWKHLLDRKHLCKQKNQLEEMIQNPL